TILNHSLLVLMLVALTLAQSYPESIDAKLRCDLSQPLSEQIRLASIVPQGDPEVNQYRYTSDLVLLDYVAHFKSAYNLTLCRTNVSEYDSLVLDTLGLAQQSKVHAVIGPAYSSSGSTVGLILGAFGVPNIGFYASSVSLSSYPYYNRVFPSDAFQVQAILALVQHYGWTRISCVHTQEDYGNGGATLLAQQAAQIGVTVDTIQAIKPRSSNADDPSNPTNEDYALLYNNLDDVKARVIITYALFPQDCSFLWDYALKNNYYMKQGVAWIVTDGCAEMVDQRPEYEGVISFFPQYNSGDYASLVKNVTSVRELVGPDTKSDTFYKGAVFSSDATKTLMLAFDSILQKDPKANLSNGEVVRDAIRATTFAGYSGQVEFDEVGDRKNPTFAISNYVNVSFSQVGTIALNGNESDVQLNQHMMFVGGSHKVPSDYMVNTYSIPLNGALGGVTGFCTLLVLFMAFVIVFEWKKFRYSSPLFCCLILLGSLLGYAAIYTLLPSPTDELCTAFPWLLGYGYVIMFGTIFTKTWRTWRLFANAHRFKIIKISNQMILTFVGVFLVIETIFLVVWTAVDRPRVVTNPIYRQGEAQNQCMSTTTAWWYAFCLYKVAYIIVGVFLAYKTRNVVDQLNESKPISLSVYNLTFVMLVAIPIGFLLTDYPTAEIVIQVVSILLAFTATACLLFLPKVWMIVSGQQHTIDSYDSSQNSGHSSQMQSNSYNNSVRGTKTDETQLNKSISQAGGLVYTGGSQLPSSTNSTSSSVTN
ncbi:hypothetical protein SAMD00019534_094870, partial [Acytostelium subglobosum LB1]|uniref:hypothetical protein n=1 Tax=Acytostelium subglobosum LB1 TaxID=1410327 RepID=UPI000644DBDE